MRIAASLRVTALRFTVASVKAKNSEVQPYHKAGAGLQSAGRSAPWSKVSRFRRPLAASGRYAETGSTAAPGRTGTYVWYPSVAAFRCTKRQRAPTDLIPESEAPGTKYLVPGTRCSYLMRRVSARGLGATDQCARSALNSVRLAPRYVAPGISFSPAT